MSSDTFQPIQGMSDIVPPEVFQWQRIEETSRKVFRLYDFEEIRTPILERTEVFTRAIGDTTDVVQKEMYTFEDRGGRSLTLRPEGTAAVMRHVAGAGQDMASARLYYMGPMFRSERPQAGRRRQFHQIGVEALGEPNPAADAEVIALQVQLLKTWGISGAQIHLNTRGLPEDRESVRNGLRELLRPHLASLSEDSRRRYDENVLRVVDSKHPEDQAVVKDLPPISEFMSQASRDYFAEVLARLKDLRIQVAVNPRLVRGLDYYIHTVWEITHPALGAQDSVSGGGRYRMQFDGRTLDGVGFALGVERILMILEKLKGPTAGLPPKPPVLWIVSLGDKAFADNLRLLHELRALGIACRMDLSGRSMKAQMRNAQKGGARQVLIRGEDELARGIFVLKEMEHGSQEEVAFQDLVQRIS